MRRKHLILAISLSAFSLIARAQNTILTGQMKGLSGAAVHITYNKDGVSKTDTVTIVKDYFTWKANLSEPQLIELEVNNYSNSLFAEPGHIKIVRVKDAARSYLISGSPTQHDAEEFGASMQHLSDQQGPIRAGYKEKSAAEKAVTDKKLNDLEKQKKNLVYQFIADHPKSFYSLYLVTSRVSFDIDYNEIMALYNKLDKSVQQTESGKKTAQKIEVLAKSRIGNPMINFTQADTSGNPVSFDNFKGKYVLVDFWASWCGPCRAENPNVLKAYNAFKDKGFTVVGISLDDKAANWKKAIRDDKMPWTQLSDLKGWKNELSTSYGIQAIPGNLLIDPQGKIVAKNLRGEMLENKLKELLNGL